MFGKMLKKSLPVFLMVVFSAALIACSKKGRELKFEYSVDDNDNIHITGLEKESVSMSKITIPSELDGKKVVAIDRGAFRDNGYIEEVIMEDGITDIAENVFYNCYHLENITFPSSVASVGTNIVKGTLYEKNKFKESEEIIVNDILVAVRSDVTHYKVPDSVKTIAPGAFYCYASLDEVEFSEHVENIGNFAFSGCTGLERLELPGNIKNIGYGAFYGCTNLTLIIPDAVESVGRDACFDVKTVIYGGMLQTDEWGAKELYKNN